MLDTVGTWITHNVPLLHTLNWNILDKEDRYRIFIYQRAKYLSDRIKAAWLEFKSDLLDTRLLRCLNDTVDEYIGEYNCIEDRL